MKGGFQPIFSMMTDSALTTSVAQKCDEPGFICKICTKKKKRSTPAFIAWAAQPRKQEAEVNLMSSPICNHPECSRFSRIYKISSLF